MCQPISAFGYATALRSYCIATYDNSCDMYRTSTEVWESLIGCLEHHKELDLVSLYCLVSFACMTICTVYL